MPSQGFPKFMTFRKTAFPRMFAGGGYPPNTLPMIDRSGDRAGARRGADRRGDLRGCNFRG